MSELPIGVGISHVMVLSKEHLTKHSFPKLVTEDGIVMDVREEQNLKQLFPKLVTEEGIVMDVRE